MSKETIKLEDTETISSQEGKVGTMLHDVRTKKKISIEEVASALYIKAAYLTAIEKSDYANIPEAPYGIGFVRSYANYLGLNSSRIVQIFKEETESSTPEVETYNIIKPEEQTEINMPNRKYLIVSLAMFIVICLFWMIFSSSDEADVADVEEEISTVENQNEEYPLQVENFATETESTVEEEQLDNQQITVTDEKFVETTAEEQKSVAETTSKEKTVSPQANTDTKTKSETTKKETKPEAKIQTSKGRVVLKVKKETWVEVKDDDKLWLSKVLQAGSEYALPDNGEGKTVSFGNTDGVDVIIDGKIVTIVSPNKKTNIKMDAFLSRNH